MSKRDVVELRKRIDAERTRLDEHLTTLEGELLSGVPLVIAGIAAAAALILKRKGKRKPRSVTITWKLK
jgi:hypothetical protein